MNGKSKQIYESLFSNKLANEDLNYKIKPLNVIETERININTSNLILSKNGILKVSKNKQETERKIKNVNSSLANSLIDKGKDEKLLTKLSNMNINKQVIYNYANKTNTSKFNNTNSSLISNAEGLKEVKHLLRSPKKVILKPIKVTQTNEDKNAKINSKLFKFLNKETECLNKENLTKEILKNELPSNTARNSLLSSNVPKKITKSIYINDETFSDSTKLGSIESMYLTKNNNNPLNNIDNVEELHFIFLNIAKKNNSIKRKFDLTESDKKTVDYLDMEIDI